MKKEERIIEVFNKIKNIINDQSFLKMIEIFNGKINFNNFAEEIEYLNNFTNIWDYRNNKERYEIDNNSIDNEEKIIPLLKNLGMIDESIPELKPDYILILGGARNSNYNRVKYSKKIVDKYNIDNAKIVALSTNRNINEIENEYINEYAKGSNTEYEVISKCLENIYKISSSGEEVVNKDTNINMMSQIKYYDEKYKNNSIISLSSPSSDIKRRANSKDTLLFFLKNFNVGKNQNVLLVTTQIYNYYQFYNLLDLAIDNNFNLECIGCSFDSKINVKLYLQELKGFINSVYKIYKKYHSILEKNNFI